VKSPRVYLAVLAAAVILIGATQLGRPGYSVDEEFTIFAVRGIQAHGLPLLPSGLLYDRGIAYSYASWAATFLPGDDLVAARLLSLISVAAALLVTFFTLARVYESEQAALLATAMAATSVPFWTAATTARFYGPFLLAYLAALYFCQRRSWIGIFAAALLARWTHELGFTLLAIPAIALLIARREHRRRWMSAGFAMAAGLALAQLSIFALHYAAPASGDTMIRRFFLWQVLNLFATPPDRQFAIPLVVMVMGWLVAPRQARFITMVALCVSAAILGISLGQAYRASGFAGMQFAAILLEGSRYPLDMFRHLVGASPLLVAFALAALYLRSLHALHFLWVGWVLWFGVIESGITTNYALLPITFMLAAVTVELYGFSQKAAWKPMLIAILLSIAVTQWRDPGVLARSRPTILVSGIEEVRATLQPSDLVACTDELACLLLVGRNDAWLALDDYVRERFVVSKADHSLVGVYGGAPAVFRPADLFSTPHSRLPTPDRVVIVDVFKEYPVGNSRTWLPRALAVDGLEARILLETPQARVVQVSAPVRNARRHSAPGTRHKARGTRHEAPGTRHQARGTI
jgi:hypothetical protein